jgi:hypothetical protein
MNTKAIDRFAYSRNGAGAADESCLIRISIPGVETEGQQTRYKIHVVNVQTRQAWQTSHRYSEFLALRNELIAHFEAAQRKCPGCVNFEKVIKLFEFPTKRYFSSSNPAVINYRKTALRAFLALLASHTFTTSPKCPTCSGVPFTSVRDFLTEETKTASSPTNSAGSGNETESIRESIQVKNFTTYIPPAKTNAVNSEGVFVHQGSKPRQHKPREQKKEKRPAKAPEPAAREMPSPPPSEQSVPSLPASPARAPAKKERSAAPAPPPVESKPSVHDEDEEFGSLNLDFLQNTSIDKD